MKSISIKAALTSLFTLMILLIGGLGYLTISKLASINDNVETFANDYLPTITAIGVIRNSVSDYRILESEHIFSTDTGSRQDKEKEMFDNEKQLSERMAAFEKLISSADGRKNYQEYKEDWQKYTFLHQKLLAISRENKSDEAASLYKGEMRSLFDEVRDDLRKSREVTTRNAASERADANAEYGTTRIETFLFIGFGMVLAIGAMAFAMFGVSRPVEQITQSMGALAKGETATAIPFGDRNNEIGAMARAVQVFKDNMIHARELEAEAEANKAKAEAGRKRQMNDMADQFERAVGGIVRTVSDSATELQSAAQALSASSTQTNHQSSAVAAASEQAAINVRTVAAAAEELSGSVREISRQVSESATMANKAVQEAQRTNAQVSGLSTGAQKIGAIVDLINDIASKTNLLALNATIEAARAGEAGKGFAVVAAEVKALAEQTSKATAEITGHIGAVQNATDQAANAILGIGRTIDEINHIASTIAAAVEEQGSATEEIARNVDQAAQGTTEVTRNITGVNHAAEAASASANQVLSSATELAQQSEKLRGEMQKFLVTVRAA